LKRPWSSSAHTRWATWGPIVLLVLANLAVGFLLAPHYGQSTDEAANILFARGSLLSYQHPADPYLDSTREDKGPFYLMLWVTAGDALGKTVAGWEFVDGRHFVNFLAFQLAVVSVYALAVRLVKPPVALAATLLFETQPLFFGHAFINQKDAPFMAFFAASVALGICALDGFDRSLSGGLSGLTSPQAKPAPVLDAFRAAWRQDPKGGLRAAVIAPFLAFALPVGRILLNGPLRRATDQMVRAAYRGEAWGPIDGLFRRIAENAARVDPAAYVHRADRVVDIGMLLLCGLMVVVAIGVAGRLWPAGRRQVWPVLAQELRTGIRDPFPRLLIPAAIVLGMSVAIRSAGLYAGALIAGYALIRAGPRAVVPMVVYLTVAGVTAVLLWPQLWAGPGALLAESLTRTIHFPELRRTLFEGVALLSTELPARYLPELMAIQFTLPAVILILAGLVIAVRSLARRSPGSGLLWVLILWALGPFIAVVVLRMPVYNYFRHVLFMMPPLFVIGALGIKAVVRPLRRRWVAAMLGAVILLPGLVAIVRLHPYEYGYFNELVGGVRGAYGRFMSDYWCTSTREAMKFVNSYAPRSAGIAVSSATSNALPFARDDLLVKDDSEITTDPSFHPTLILGCSWATVNPYFYSDAPLLFSVQRDGVPLVVVKLLATPQPAETPAAP
jgi:4-amino-4-deoxy-L-arabinose transferase-like glycosyltransferase